MLTRRDPCRIGLLSVAYDRSFLAPVRIVSLLGLVIVLLRYVKTSDATVHPLQDTHSVSILTIINTKNNTIWC